MLVGLTGGIASGKSEAGAIFSSHGITLISADEISRDISINNEDVVDLICKKFNVYSQSGGIDRSRLKKIIFNDKRKKKQLEDIMHPLIKAEIKKIIAQLPQNLIIIEVPLLFEAGWNNWMDRSLLIASPRKARIKRLMERDGVNLELAGKIIDGQMTGRDREKLADDIIYNDGDKHKLQRQVAKVMDKYLRLAAKKSYN